MLNAKTLLSGVFFLLLSLPAMADAHVDCDGNGTIDLVCEGSLCHHQDGATGGCSCAQTAGGGPGPVKSCMNDEPPSIAGDFAWRGFEAEAFPASEAFSEPAQGDEKEAGEADAPALCTA